MSIFLHPLNMAVTFKFLHFRGHEYWNLHNAHRMFDHWYKSSIKWYTCTCSSIFVRPQPLPSPQHTPHTHKKENSSIEKRNSCWNLQFLIQMQLFTVIVLIQLWSQICTMKKGLHPQMQWISYVTQSGRLMHVMMTKIHHVGKVYHFRAKRQMAESVGQIAKFKRRYEKGIAENVENAEKWGSSSISAVHLNHYGFVLKALPCEC